MARTNSTQIYVQESVADLEVVPIFNDLMVASTNKNSLYIKAKESMTEYFASEDCILSEREKAEMLVTLVSNMAVQMTNSSLSSAIAIAKEDRDGDYAMTKLREDTLLTQEQRDKVAAENLFLGEQIDNEEAERDLKVIQGWKMQTDMVRENGTIQANMPSTGTAILPATSISDSGLKWEQEQQTKMSVYATLAKSYRESGVVRWTVDSEGKVNSIMDANPQQPGLTKAQERVAIRQEIAFDDNKRQHAANSSANMIGLLLSAEESGNITAADVEKWRNAVDYLNSTTIGVGNPALLPGSVYFEAVPDSMSKAVGGTITGTTVNMSAGTAVAIEFTDGSDFSSVVTNLVQMDGTWSVDIIGNDLELLSIGTVNVTVTIIDQLGVLRSDIDTLNLIA